MNKLYLIDGMSIVFRAYHAMSNSGLKAPNGEPTGALFGFVNIITSLLDKEKPERLIVVFDRAEPTFRHELYPLYKANRDEFPEELIPQMKRIKEFLDYANIYRTELAGFEADDIIGTLSRVASENNNEVICLTSDKDFYQLVNDRVRLYKPSRLKTEDFDIVHYPEVEQKFGVTPEKVIDVLAILGDSSDNVPGVKGLGEKTVIPLIQKYGSLENLYENLNNIEKPAVKNKLIENKDNAFLSKVLVTIDTNVPVDLSIIDKKLATPDYHKLDELFAEVGFTTIRNKWLKRAQTDVSDITIEVKTKETITDIQKTYKLIETEEQLKELVSAIKSVKILSVDLETSSLNKQTCEIVGIALSAKEGTGYYVAVKDIEEIVIPDIIYDDSGQGDLFGSISTTPNEIETEKIEFQAIPIKATFNLLRGIFEDKAIGKCGQNIKFDASILKRKGINLSPIIFDSMIASYLLNPDDLHNLDALSKKWLNYTPIPISSLIGEKKSKQISMKSIDPKEISDYACEDADLALKLMNKMIPVLEEEKLSKLAIEIEFPLIEVLVDMENNGVALDKEFLKILSKQIDEEAAELTKKIFAEAGVEFNIDSPKQLGHVLFEKMMIPPTKKTKTGFSTDVQVLTELAPIYPIAQMLVDYRQLVKLNSTYVDALPKLINPTTGRIHTTYNQTIAATGRLSSTDPNLQNIPIRTELGTKVREAFIAQQENSIILSADYSQVELRIMAYYCQDKHLIDAFKDGLDIHSATAAILFDKKLDEVDSNMRRVAKTVNFGIMYGLGSFGLAQRLGISRTEGKEIIDNYFNKYPGIKDYMDLTIENTRKKGYSETLLGRRRYFPDILNRNQNLRAAAERGAINMPIQGTASDMMKIAMIKVYKSMKQEQVKSIMMLQVHDELVFEVPIGEVELMKKLVSVNMETALALGEIPIIVDIGTGKNWFEAH
jgi:DNA polymerase-1